MKLGYDLTIEQTQKLTMTPELIQAIQILQFNTQELDSFVQDELMQNPVLEYDSMEGKKDIEVSKTEAMDKKEAEESDFDLREKVKEAEYDDISYKQWEYSKDNDQTSFVCQQRGNSGRFTAFTADVFKAERSAAEDWPVSGGSH